jgi:multidrug resistance protein, MATE family
MFMSHRPRLNSLFGDLRTIGGYAGPLIVTNVAMAGMTAADTVMAGRLGAADLAAVAVGANYYGIFYLGGMGLLMSLSPSVAHAYGAGRDADVTRLFRQGLWIALVVAVVVVIGLLGTRRALLAIGTAPATATLAGEYVRAAAFGIPATMGFLVLRFGSEGLGWTRPIMWAALLGLGANVAGNYVFMYGKFGLPALGAVGCGVATALVQWIMLGYMVLHVRRHRIYRVYAPLRRLDRPDPQLLRSILRLGLPISGSILAEGGLFGAAGMMASTLGAQVMASHAIALSYAALMFMVPLSLHSATTIHVGHLLGAGDRAAGARAGWAGIGACAVFMLVSALVLVAARHGVAALYTVDPDVRMLAAQLLMYAAAFQLADGLQVGTAGALRGFKDARVPMWLTIVAYWGVAMPLAWYWGYAAGDGAPGIWLALIVGLLAAAALLLWRYRIISRRGSG